MSFPWRPAVVKHLNRHGWRLILPGIVLRLWLDSRVARPPATVYALKTSRATRRRGESCDEQPSILKLCCYIFEDAATGCVITVWHAVVIASDWMRGTPLRLSNAARRAAAQLWSMRPKYSLEIHESSEYQARASRPVCKTWHLGISLPC